MTFSATDTDSSGWATREELAMYDAGVDADGAREREMRAADEDDWPCLIWRYRMEDKHGELYFGEYGGVWDSDGDRIWRDVDGEWIW